MLDPGIVRFWQHSFLNIHLKWQCLRLGLVGPIFIGGEFWSTSRAFLIQPCPVSVLR